MKTKSDTEFIQLLLDTVAPSSVHAKELLSHLRSRSTGDPNYRYQITAIIILLSGYDKALGIALCFLYLANIVEWSWLTTRNTRLPPGYIMCERGLSEKVRKIEELGCNLDNLKYLISIRNRYIHEYYVSFGYKIDWKEDTIILEAKGPTIQYSDAPLVTFSGRQVDIYDIWLCGVVGKLLTRCGCGSAIRNIMRKIESLPKNPEPEYSELSDSKGNQVETIDKLNLRLIGKGAEYLV